MSTLAVNRPCFTCGCDRLHIGLICNECKTPTYLKPLDQPTARQRMYAARAGKKGGRRRHAHGFGVPLTIGRGRA